MLKDEDRIFKNLYNDLGWEIDFAIKQPSISFWGSNLNISLSLQVPGSDSSALITR